ncbi:MAG: transcriptional regulator [Acidobacteriota bacterium]|nr:transcriptional regulator [Acidobacteriota bacterium]
MIETREIHLNNQTFITADDNTVSREELAKMTNNNVIERVERGIYRHPKAKISEFDSLILANVIAPKGVICLLSALRFYDLTTQNPFEIWMALKPHAYRPKADSISFRFVHFSGKSLTEGIEEHQIGNDNVRVYSIAKTLADCFKFRNKIGLDVALEALREAREKKLFAMDDLWRFAKICRVQKVMRPYLEAL